MQPILLATMTAMLAPLNRDTLERGTPLQNVDPGGHYRLLENGEPQKSQISCVLVTLLLQNYNQRVSPLWSVPSLRHGGWNAWTTCCGSLCSVCSVSSGRVASCCICSWEDLWDCGRLRSKVESASLHCHRLWLCRSRTGMGKTFHADAITNRTNIKRFRVSVWSSSSVLRHLASNDVPRSCCAFWFCSARATLGLASSSRLHPENTKG